MNASRKEQIAKHLRKAGLNALVCALPKNVLMLSGYWPVVGTGMAIASDDGVVRLIVPEDEKEFATPSFATNIETFKPSSLKEITTAAQQIKEPLSHMLRQLDNYVDLRIGYEQGSDTEPSSYAAMHLYQGKIPEIIREALSTAKLVTADDLLRQLRTVKTGEEISDIETGCSIAQQGFEQAAEVLRPGVTELEAAYEIRKRFAAALNNFRDVQRTEAFVFAMSGKNSAKAHGAFAHSTTKVIEEGDLVLVHCNSFADGLCTDITRTFSIGHIDDSRQAMYEAVFAARQSALAKIAPGVKAADVDHAARSVLTERGFGENFKHSTGHGVGFGAISPDAQPRLHPKSEDVLQPGMVFNVEPAIYIDDFGGIRHCDMVAVTSDGFKLLTPFLTEKQDLVIQVGRSTHA